MMERTFSARLGCRYLLHVPENLDVRTVLVAALHGFGGNAEDMLRLAGNMVGPRQAVAAIEGPYGFFLGTGTDQGVRLGHQPACGGIHTLASQWCATS